MAAILKSIAFKTSKLSATKDFFINSLGFKIKESTYKHFVIYSKDVRIVFLESDSDLEIEFFVDSKLDNFINMKDPNDIKITIKNFNVFN
jgi:catechol-2,3-dioxygenase